MLVGVTLLSTCFVNAASFVEGQSTAFKWYSAGCRTLEDLRNQKGGVRLNPAQLIGLQYYDGINPATQSSYVLEADKPLAWAQTSTAVCLVTKQRLFLTSLNQ